ncbi:MAG: hypothetical protein IPO08_24635 [Xanthomonadales bacterium]|nr:hypothetical protein [Xanthomonadales bacterium]
MNTTAQQTFFGRHLRIGLFALLLACNGTAFAQVLDDVQASSDAATTTIDIDLLAQINYQRYLVLPSGDTVQVYFTVTAGDDYGGDVLEESRSVPPNARMPGFEVRFASSRATGTQRRLDVDFASAVDVVQVGLGRDNRSLRIVIRNPERTPPASTAVPATVAGVDVSDPQVALGQAKSALAAQQYEQAIAILNRILNLPPNAASRNAQELIGDVRAALGEVSRARAEYNLYLKLYPSGEETERVRQSLAALVEPAADSTSGEARAPQWMHWGSASLSYYGGQSRIQNETTIVTPATNATEIDIQTISGVDQSAFVSNLDTSSRYRSTDWDNRFVFRDVATYSLLSDVPSQNRLSALFGDFKYQPLSLTARVGRQSSTGNGVLGRFDGGTAGWSFLPGWRVIAMAGVPVDSGLGESKTFAGAAVENTSLIDGMTATFYGINQTTEGVTDRRALGGELRYFRAGLSLFSVFDYDVNFSELNIASAQGSWTFNKGTTVNALYDLRRGPTLQMSNALLGETAASLDVLRSTLSLEQIEQQALGLSPQSEVILLGATHPVSSSWQLGLEGRVSSVDGTLATATLPAMEGTGSVYAVTAQAIGTGLWMPSSVLVLSTSRLTSDNYDAWLLAANSRMRFGVNWIFEPGLRWYRQNNVTGNTLRRLSPSVRSQYRFNDHSSLELELTLERSVSDAALSSETSNLLFYYLSYRYDF